MTFDELLAWVHPAWHRDAACKEHPELSWFPIAGLPPMRVANVCAACTVRAECLADALDRGERYGVWGGLSYYERKRLSDVAA